MYPGNHAKVLLKLSEVSNNGVLLIYKNEVGLLSEVVKLEIWDNIYGQYIVIVSRSINTDVQDALNSCAFFGQLTDKRV